MSWKNGTLADVPIGGKFQFVDDSGKPQGTAATRLPEGTSHFGIGCRVNFHKTIDGRAVGGYTELNTKVIYKDEDTETGERVIITRKKCVLIK